MENDEIQIFDGRHRITALQRLSSQTFQNIFGEKGVPINIYANIPTNLLFLLSQSNLEILF